MTNESELKRLEGYVGKLLQSFKELKEENGRLTSVLQEREETISSLQNQLAANDQERNEIGNRVSGILDQIEEWEIDLGEEVFDQVAENDATGRQGSLFNPAEAEVTEETSYEPQQEGSRFGEM